MQKIFLSLGTNIGDREQNLIRCIEALEGRNINIVRNSSIYETEPYGDTAQPNFYNMVVRIKTSFTPTQLLYETKLIEKQFGRKKTGRWGPRIIDIDILTYNRVSLQKPELIIPHPQLHKRRFVLIPLKEVDNRFVHPTLKKNVDQILAECEDNREVRIVKKCEFGIEI